MERNERLKAADKCASKYTNENEARIARESFMLGCEFEAQGEIVKGVVLETEDEHWKPSELEIQAIKTAIYILTEERNFQQAGKHLKDILAHYEGSEPREDWKPSEEQPDAELKRK